MSTSDLSYKEYSFADHKAVYLALEETFKAFDIHYYLIGANARDIALYKAGKKPIRATVDIDFAVMVPDIQTFLALRTALTEKGFTHSLENHPYRTIYKESQTVVDILPYGGQSKKSLSGIVDLHIELSGVGMHEVGEEIEVFEHPEGISIPVTPAHGIVILKLISWSEMPVRNKDLKDIKSLLDAAWNLYEEELFQENSSYADLFEDENFDMYLIAARVMGRKMQGILNKNEALNKLIISELEKELNTSIGPKSQQLASGTDQSIAEIKSLFNALYIGIKDKRKGN